MYRTGQHSRQPAYRHPSRTMTPASQLVTISVLRSEAVDLPSSRRRPLLQALGGGLLRRRWASIPPPHPPCRKGPPRTRRLHRAAASRSTLRLHRIASRVTDQGSMRFFGTVSDLVDCLDRSTPPRRRKSSLFDSAHYDSFCIMHRSSVEVSATMLTPAPTCLLGSYVRHVVFASVM